jgi:hypothetical protein
MEEIARVAFPAQVAVVAIVVALTLVLEVVFVLAARAW